jgi:Cu2+-exporting ATPase
LGAIAATPDIADDLSRYVHRTGERATIEIAVRGAHCANCIAKIERGVSALPGVEEARLNLSTGKLAVAWRAEKDLARSIIQRVKALGYDAFPFEAAEVSDERSNERRDLLRRLAVAGFGTVFVVGLTDAVWYGGVDMGAVTRDLFFWLAAAVSIPATLYAGMPFFTSAAKSLSHRQTNMDVPIGAAIVLSLALSLYQTFSHQHATYFDAAIMLTFLLLVGRYLDFSLRDRARGAARHLLALQSVLSRRLNPDGNIETVPAGDLAVGDRVLLAAGERTAVDGVLEGGTDVDLSLVTGESMPVPVAKGGMLRAGSVVVGRPCVLRATARVEDSLVADLARLLEAGQQTRNLYVRMADRAARAYVPFVTIASIAAFALWATSGAGIAASITNAITVLIITCPCALGLAVPAVQIVATVRLFERGVFVKSGDALERLAQIDVTVFDKTGTLTVGSPELHDLDVPGEVLAAAAMLARASQHPLARALANAAGSGPIADGVREEPGRGLEAVVLGRTQRLGSAAWCGEHNVANASELWFRDGDMPAVRFSFGDRMRIDAPDTIQALKARGIAVEMLTGDRERPASELAARAGISDWHAGVTPEKKAQHIKALGTHGHRVLMIGDGINDAGALAMAHVSIALGSAADVSQLAADMVLRGDALMPVVEAIGVARKARRLVLQNFALAAVYNGVAIPIAALGLVNPLVAAAMMASSSLLVTFNALRLAGGKV